MLYHAWTPLRAALPAPPGRAPQSPGMPARLLATSSEGARSFLSGSRTRLLLAGVLAAVLYALGYGYHELIRQYGEPATPAIVVAYNVLILACYALLWVLLNYAIKQRQGTPTRVLWRTLIIGVLIVALGYGVSRIGYIGVGDSVGILNGVPQAWATVLKMNALSLLEITFAFLLLLRLRDLVLFKRTRRSERNWILLLTAMVLASLSAFMMEPSASQALGEWNTLTILLLIPAIVLMIINSFRLSWVIFLPFREKMASIGLTVAFLALLCSGLLQGHYTLIPTADRFLSYYSYPLLLFVFQTLLFGILYCTTTFLSLLFHLPTTSDFQQKVGEMAALQSLTNLVSQVFDFDRLVSTIVASPVEAGSAQTTWLALPDLQSGTLRPQVVAAHNITAAEVEEQTDLLALYDEVSSRREPLLLEQAPADHRVHAKPGEGLGSLLAVPLVARDDMLGALFMAKDVTHAFEQDDVEAMGVFAAQAALALDNARLFEERLEKERLARELSIAREVQQRLLPQRVPHLDGVTLAASSVSAHEVGGDYYDFIKIDEHRLSFIVADVSGKGTSAAFYMAEMQGIFHSVGRTASPADFLARANEALSHSLDKNAFITVISGMLDLEREELVLARAGHSPAAMINLQGEARYLRSRGLGLGLDHSGVFERTLDEERLALQPGDVFVLYTDGVVESRNATGEEYGYERLIDALREHRHEEADELHSALLEDLNTFIGHGSYDDDMTLLVLKWHGINLAATRVEPAAEQKPAARSAMLPEKL